MNFKIGQKIVCINDEPHWSDNTSSGLKRNEIYTVSSIE